jgi:hypothetical protein
MTELRKRMFECLKLRGLSARTQESYVRAVRQLAEHYHKSPELISEEELRQYFLYIKNVKVADIFRLHGPDYRAKFSQRMLPSHLRAVQDIEICLTETLGGQLYYCAQCDEQRYSYHSCKNRHCPKCQNEQANQWLEEQKTLLGGPLTLLAPLAPRSHPS